MVERKEYLDQLWAWKDERQIKVVTGIRRCGKSVLLEQYQQRLLANCVSRTFTKGRQSQYRKIWFY